MNGSTRDELNPLKISKYDSFPVILSYIKYMNNVLSFIVHEGKLGLKKH